MAAKRRDRHPLLQDRPQGEWCPEAVGKVRGYPRTQTTYDAQVERLLANRQGALEAGKLTRAGVPNGWAGKKPEIAEIRRNSRTEAERLVEVICETDDWRAALALQTVMEIVRSEVETTAIRLSAMRAFLDFTVPKPVARKIMKGDPFAALQRLVDALKADAEDSDDDEIAGRTKRGFLIDRQRA
jgi:hypothetical protein